MTKRHGAGYAVRSDTLGKSTFLASSDALASDGLVIEKGAWDLDRFKRNSLILWAHDWGGQRPPIGKATNIGERAEGLVVDIQFDMADPFAADIARKVKEGYLSAVSVGFDVLEQVGNRVKRAVLFEVSVVPVPADPNALAIARSAYNRSTSTDDWWKQPHSGPSRRTFSPNELAIIDGLLSATPAVRQKALSGMTDRELATVNRLLRAFEQSGTDGAFQLRMSRAIRGAVLDFAQKGAVR